MEATVEIVRGVLDAGAGKSRVETLRALARACLEQRAANLIRERLASGARDVPIP